MRLSLMFLVVILLFCGHVAPAAGAEHAKALLNAPVARVGTFSLKIHGRNIPDPYFWLRQRKSAEVIKYLKAENSYTEAMMAPEKELRENLFKEMVARINETDLSVPERMGAYFYYDRTEKGKQYKIHCRKKGGLDASEEILMDENVLASGLPYFSLGTFALSPDQKILAYSVDSSGGEKYTMRFKELSTGKLFADTILKTAGGLVWANDNRTVFYTMPDSTNRSYRIFRHVLGYDPKYDELIFEEKDAKFSAYLAKTKDEKWLLISTDSSTSSEMYLMRADKPDGKFQIFAARRPKVEYSLVHHDKFFYLITNENALNFKIMKVPETDFARKNWVEFVPHRLDVKIDGMEVFRDHLAIYERQNALRTLRTYNIASATFTDVSFPEPVYSFWEAGNPEFDTNILRFNYTSLTTPESVFDLNMDTGERVLKKQYKVKGPFRSKNYIATRVYATAADGEEIPISIVHRKDLKLDGRNPMYLTGYGAYGSSYDPYFSTIRLSLLERGFVYAIAHVRGGEEKGRIWYETGKMKNKKNTFTDFIACAEYLIKAKYTSRDLLAIQGGSAGGLLIGAVVNMRPDLFGAVVADVPFVDVINTMNDASIPLTVGEYEEWGNPANKADFEYILSYSPYDNVRAADYPPMLITAGLNDSRVQYWEPAKWTAKLRATKTDNNLLLLRTNMGAGHAGSSGRYDFMKDIALEYAFLIKVFKQSWTAKPFKN